MQISLLDSSCRLFNMCVIGLGMTWKLERARQKAISWIFLLKVRTSRMRYSCNRMIFTLVCRREIFFERILAWFILGVTFEYRFKDSKGFLSMLLSNVNRRLHQHLLGMIGYLPELAATSFPGSLSSRPLFSRPGERDPGTRLNW